MLLLMLVYFADSGLEPGFQKVLQSLSKVLSLSVCHASGGFPSSWRVVFPPEADEKTEQVWTMIWHLE